MKKINCLLLLSLLLSLTSCIKEKPNERAILNLQGPVKSCEYNTRVQKYFFEENGMFMAYEVLFDGYHWTTELNHREIVLKSPDSNINNSVVLSYDKKGRLTKVVEENVELKGKNVTKYKYKGDDVLPYFKSFESSEGKVKGDITYNKVDDYGNWLSMTWNNETDERVFTYYDLYDASGSLTNCPTDVTFDKELFMSTLISILILIAFFAMLIHMSWVIFNGKLRMDYTVIDFVERRRSKGISEVATDEENQMAKDLISSVYNQWKTIKLDEVEAYLPSKGTVVHKSYDAVKKAVALNPTDEEAVNFINNFSEILNRTMERQFTGSKIFIGIAIVVAIVISLIGALPMGIFIVCGCILYFLSSRKALWQIFKDESKGGNKSNFLNAMIGGLFAGVATAKTVRTVTKWDDGTTTTEDDHSETWFSLIFLIIGCVLLSVAIYLIAFINYLRNYVIYW